MRISLATTTKDEAGSIGDLIAAVDAQTRPPDEWIVADGGSTDETVERLAATGRCTVLRGSGNIAQGRNRAIAASSGELVAVTDAGCIPEPTWLERLVGPLEAGRADVAAGATRHRVRSSFDAAQAIVLDQFVLDQLVLGGWSVREPALSSRSLAFRREVWAAQRYPEWLDHGEDTWLLRRWQQLGWRCTRVPAAVVEWTLRHSLQALMRQHYRYMRGDGIARMHSGRHTGRFVFYGAVAAGLASAPWQPLGGWAAAALWVLYLGATAARLPQVVGSGGPAMVLGAGSWLPPVLLAVDSAKAAGYLAGRIERWRRPTPEEPCPSSR